jgi:uncharacterized membrane protein
VAHSRLDQPRVPGGLRRPNVDPELIGKASERIARFLGTGRFLLYLTVFILVWVTWNTFGPEDLQYDPYPFIFLTLLLSIQASYAAPLILLAQNRQDDRDRVNLEQDREVNARSRADMEFLAREVASLRIAVGEMTTRDFLRSELRELADELTGSRVSEHQDDPV